MPGKLKVYRSKFLVDINMKETHTKTGYTHEHANNIKTECLQEFKNCAENSWLKK